MRDIALRADVSPGLITHHFGTKTALRRECDAEVLRRYHEVKERGVEAPNQQLIGVLSDPGMSATLLVYILRAVLAGGEPARRFLDRLIDDLRPVMAHAVETGLARPSRDEEARLHALTHLSLGAMLVRFLLDPTSSPERFLASLHDPARDDILPLLEIFTEGVLGNADLLEQYLTYRDGSPT